MIQIPTTREREARHGEVVRRIWTQFLNQSLKNDVSSECKLGREPQHGRSDKCSTCTFNADLKELDRAIAELIADKIIVCPSHCPYQSFARALLIALVVGPGAEETAKESERSRIIELKTALRHIDRAVKTLAPRRQDIKYLVRLDEELFSRLNDVVTAEKLIDNAVKFLIENAKRNYGEETDFTRPRDPSRGRSGFLDIQGIVSTCDSAWKELMGKSAPKRNQDFHGLLQAAAETVLGPLDPEPDWEWQIVASRRREKGWKSEQKSQD